MLRIAGLIVMYRPESAVAYTALAPLGFESGPVFATEGTVRVSWVTHAADPFPMKKLWNRLQSSLRIFSFSSLIL